MTASLAPNPWNSRSGVAAPGAPAWRFGREVALPGGGTALQWVLKRNCSMSPRQMGGFYLSLCLVSAVIAAGFWVNGAPFVTAFAGIELLLVGVALLVHARHASDREVLLLQGGTLRVEVEQGARTKQFELDAGWLTVEPAAAQGSLVALAARGQRLRVGRFLRPELRGPFAQELRRALRRAQDGGAGGPAAPAPEPETT